MPNPGGQFFSDEFGDIEDYFVSDYQLIDQYIGDQLWTWGRNNFGQLGINNITDKSTPVTTFAGGTNWKSISGGLYHIAAIKTDGTLWNWGYNAFGQLGINATTNRSTPVTTFAGGTNWKSVAGGYGHTLAIKTDGTLWTWGRNDVGQLGINNITDKSTPVTTFAGGTNWKSVDCGVYHTAAIKTDGTLWTWGRNYYGQLGINNTADKSTPVTTSAGGTNWKSVACGSFHTAAIKTDGTLWIWGYNVFGQLGINVAGGTTHRTTPVTTLAGGTNWKSVSGGSYHTAAIKTDGTLWTWGQNSYGQLGINDAGITTNRTTPVTTSAGGTNWKSVDCGYYYTAAIKTDGTLWTWGRNDVGQLGINNTVGKLVPQLTFGERQDWKSVAGAGEHTVALTAGVDIDFTPPTSIIFDVPGTYTWVAPEGVTSVSVVCVGGGGGGATNTGGASGAGGGGLGYKNNISVTPGIGYTVVVGSGGATATTGTAGAGGNSYFISLSTVAGYGGGGGACASDTAGVGGTYFGAGGGNGGSGGSRTGSTTGAGGGGGAGGYAGNGGTGGAPGVNGNAAATSSGAGGGGGGCGSADTAGSGGGVGLNGQGSDGAGGAGSTADAAGGFGGSGGTNASQASATAPGNVYSTTVLSTPGRYGGGGAGSDNGGLEVDVGGGGAVRIVWSGVPFP